MKSADAEIALTLAEIEDRLARHRAQEIPIPDGKRAAVACLLRASEYGPEVLLMKRSVRPGDSWSGHISFPGGREETGDADLRTTAVRETHEEVGIDLDRTSRFIGQLDTIHAVARGRIRPLTITPFVFIQTRPAVLRLNHEAEATFWLPLARAASGEFAGQYPYRFGSEEHTLPCWHFAGHVVWGLTYQMLERLLQVVT